MATNIRVNSFSCDNNGAYERVECSEKDYSGDTQILLNKKNVIDKSKVETNKTATITENGEGIEITPSSGKDAMSKVTLTVDVDGDIQANKAVTITTNTVTEITPDDGKDGMAKVTVTTNVPTTSVTPPEWYTDGEDSIIPADTTVAMANLSEQSSNQTINFIGDGENTIAEQALAQSITVDTLSWLWNDNGVMILGYTNE